MQYSNPRREFQTDDWPSGRSRVFCRFWIETDTKRGERVCRETEDKHGNLCKPKKKTYCQRAAIVTGDDGRTYLLEQMERVFGFISIGSSDMRVTLETVHDNSKPELHAELVALLDAADGRTVCPNCEQWQHPRADGSPGDCFHECRKRGFAPTAEVTA